MADDAKRLEDSIEIKEDKDGAVSNSVAFPGADSFERKAKAEPVVVDSDKYCEVVAGRVPDDFDWNGEEAKEMARQAREFHETFIDWDSWIGEVRRRARKMSSQCQKALEEGRFDHCLMKWFRQGKHPLYVIHVGFFGWDLWHGYGELPEDFF